MRDNGVKSSQPKAESPEVRHVSPERETTPHETDETEDPTRSAGECTLGDYEVTLEPSDVNSKVNILLNFYTVCTVV